jgi:LPXTG-site transpeptidase (sortase) family protein
MRNLRRFRNHLSWLLLAGGVFFLFKGGSFLYSLALPSVELENDRLDALPIDDSLSIRSPREGTYLGRLRIPRLESTLHVLEGISDETLRSGPGHLPQSTLPGAEGNSVIAGHRDTHFRVLKDVRIGDDIVIDRGSKSFRYRVVETRVVRPSDTSPLLPASERTLTLITCYPFRFIGPAPERFIVTATGL